MKFGKLILCIITFSNFVVAESIVKLECTNLVISKAGDTRQRALSDTFMDLTSTSRIVCLVGETCSAYPTGGQVSQEENYYLVTEKGRRTTINRYNGQFENIMGSWVTKGSCRPVKEEEKLF